MSRWSSFEQDQQYTDSWRQFIEKTPLGEASRLWRGGTPSGEIPDPEAGGSGRSPPAEETGTTSTASGRQKAAAGAEKAHGTVTSAWDTIAGFLSGKPKQKDYSHLKIPRPSVGVGAPAAGEEATTTPGEEAEEPAAEPEEEPESEEGTDEEPMPELEPLPMPEVEPLPDPGSDEWHIEAYDAWAAEQGVDQSLYHHDAEYRSSVDNWIEKDITDDLAVAAINRYLRRETPTVSTDPKSARRVTEQKTYNRWSVLAGVKKSVI